MTRIVLDRVTKTYRLPKALRHRGPALSELALTVEEGEFLVLVGPSGCGKSTALRLIAGLEEATSGDIYFDDVNVTDLPVIDRNIAFVFQDLALYPHLTVADNIGFPLRMARLPKEAIAEKVWAAARLLKIVDQLNKRPSQLSGGQRQRVAMGRSIVRDPDVFLMDEPLSNLDAMLRIEMRTEISALQRELGRTTVYVTHDGEEAMTMGHRVAVLRDGILQQCGAPSALYATPVNAFVAGFVGSPQMNFVAGMLWHDLEWQVAFGPTLLTLSDSIVARHPRLGRREGVPVIVGFRPETICIDPEAPDTVALDIDVTSVQQYGKETRVLFRAPEYGQGVGEIPELDRITNKVGRSGDLMMTLTPAQPMEIGEHLRLRLDPDAVHLFDRSGLAL
jgi:multiple sugar transport system ATP-binding protein